MNNPVLLLILNNILSIVAGSLFGIGVYVMYRLDLKWKKEEGLEEVHCAYDANRAQDNKRYS